MTYSQRSTHAAAASDITYLEYQIGLAGEELKEAQRVMEIYEADLRVLTASPGYEPDSDVPEEQQLREQAARQQALIEAIRATLAGLEDELAKLED
ncbi:hypothetical protein PAECIP111892_02784 [Paenibacillus auburnensis]|uniref:DUF2524 domain-containing protein n=1 Tax=Paenibacillus auburnensis TaxID=2905649 RepID=A0ABN8GFE5_9BACL|nr:hypothetical protein [Paenibacillus auburnensis]CAH1205855.1 hypothetical protein PAECIP111892_02784 [Paenibacillus auburnensis]